MAPSTKVAGGSVLAALALCLLTGAPANALPAGAYGSQGAYSQDGADAIDRVHGEPRPNGVQAISAKIPSAADLAGRWVNNDGRLVVAVTSARAAARVRAAGAVPQQVARSQADLDLLRAKVDRAARADTGNHLQSWGIDPVTNSVVVKTRDPKAFKFSAPGVRVVKVSTSFKQQAGDVNPGDPWWPGSESNCSVGFGATDAQGNKHFLTAGHCTNDVNQAAYGESGQRNKIGTSNVGGSRSINAREGDMGVVAVTETGWNLSASVNTWGQPAVTVTGAAEAIVGDSVCHSGNTAPNFECGKVRSVNQSIDYGNVVIDGLTTTDACSQGGDSGGAWLRGSEAVGLHSGGENSCTANQDNSIFQPVKEALTKWGLTLYTGTPDPGDDEAPTTPGNPRSTGTTADSVSLAWDASVDNIGVTGYEVYNGSTLATTVAGTTATVSGLTADTAYSFTIQAKDAAGNKSKPTVAESARTQPGDTGGGRTFVNGSDYPIRDYQVTISKISSTATGKPASPFKVTVEGNHTCLEDLNISVVSPSGRWYYLQRYGGTTCHPLPASKTYSVTPATTEAAAGTWTLRIGDNGPGDTGTLTGWSLTL
ncbi:proprotein convertase P-domain-containing protein [Kribbella sp. NBC_01245]|uniref:proprotein convertase P-domain-containing protein n=1 Tax=Kribbella sp. NBC_01245 TaxID=2903578 RepID=UPI002E2B944D|nr:proprotein convertase P-domain-containing protein [Kribbella sp. NBC_01245]